MNKKKKTIKKHRQEERSELANVENIENNFFDNAQINLVSILETTKTWWNAQNWLTWSQIQLAVALDTIAGQCARVVQLLAVHSESLFVGCDALDVRDHILQRGNGIARADVKVNTAAARRSHFDLEVETALTR